MKVCIKSFQGFVLCNTVPLMSVSNIVCRIGWFRVLTRDGITDNTAAVRL